MPANPRRISVLLIVCLSYICNKVHADAERLGFGFENETQSVTIPFQSFNNLIILEAVIDGKLNLNLILDTGIRSLVLFDKSYVPKISRHTFDIQFTGTGASDPIAALVSVNHDLSLGNDVTARQINAVILQNSNPYLHNLKGIKIHGVFGYQLFSRFQVKIDYRNQLITLCEPISAHELAGYDAVPLTIHDTKPFIETHFLTKRKKWQVLSLMVDLGANHKILLKDNSKISGVLFQSPQEHERIAEGLSGSIMGTRAMAHSIRIGLMNFMNTELLIPTKGTYSSETSEFQDQGTLGGAFFENSTIVLDYINGFLYIENPDYPKS